MKQIVLNSLVCSLTLSTLRLLKGSYSVFILNEVDRKFWDSWDAIQFHILYAAALAVSVFVTLLIFNYISQKISTLSLSLKFSACLGAVVFCMIYLYGKNSLTVYDPIEISIYSLALIYIILNLKSKFRSAK